eukprot:4555750-Alexandrium_andersonii.AAC.1
MGWTGISSCWGGGVGFGCCDGVFATARTRARERECQGESGVGGHGRGASARTPSRRVAQCK